MNQHPRCYHDYAYLSTTTLAKLSINKDRPYVMDPHSGLIVVRLCSLEDEDYLFFFHCRALLSTARILGTSFDSGKTAMDTRSNLNHSDTAVDWDEWGPNISRVMLAPDTSYWAGRLHGFRFVTMSSKDFASTARGGDFLKDIPVRFEEEIYSNGYSMPNKDLTVLTSSDTDVKDSVRLEEKQDNDAAVEEGNKEQDTPENYLLVFDFNPTPIARGAQSFTSATSDCFVVTAEERCREPFDEEVITTLPCRVSASKSSVDFSRVFVDYQSIAGLYVSLLLCHYPSKNITSID